MEKQRFLEEKYHRNKLIPRIISEFQNHGFEQHMDAAGIPQDFGFHLMAQMVLHKQTTVEVLVGVLWKFLKDSQATADMLVRCVQADLVDYNMETQRFVTRFVMPPHVQEELNAFQFPLPMVCQPEPVETNRDTGYLTEKGSIVLQAKADDKDHCLDHINRMNRIPLRVDAELAAVTRNVWKGLAKPKAGETYMQHKRKLLNFQNYDNASRAIIEFLKDETIYLTHRYDMRGRTYCHGYHINYQGTDWNKSIIEFAEKEYASDDTERVSESSCGQQLRAG